MTDLDAVFRQSLKSFTDFVFSNEWRGMEREAVSLFAFGYLVRQCQPGSVLFDAAQIGIEVRVPKPGVLGKKPTGELSENNKKQLRICKDLIVWSEPATTWLHNVSPLAVMEWKVNESQVSARDVDWLRAFSDGCPEFTGYAVCLDMERRNFRLSCTRVMGGEAQPDWLVL